LTKEVPVRNRRLLIALGVLAAFLGLVISVGVFRYARYCTNLENFERIEVGMTREEVTGIMGRPPDHTFPTVEAWKPENEREPIPTALWEDEWCGFRIYFSPYAERVTEKRIDESISHPRLHDRMKDLRKMFGW
jgi:hypothetical protein